MEVETFDSLCGDVLKQVGKEEFKPELYLLEKLMGDEKIPPIVGEVKMAVPLLFECLLEDHIWIWCLSLEFVMAQF